MSRKPKQHVPAERYKDVRRHYFVCDDGHRFFEDYAVGTVGRRHGYCTVDGCDAPVELDYYATALRPDGRVDDGRPIQLIEVPVEHETLPSTPLEEVVARGDRR